MNDYIALNMNGFLYNIIKKFPHFVIDELFEDAETRYIVCVSNSLGDKFSEYLKDRGDPKEIFKDEIAEIESILNNDLKMRTFVRSILIDDYY